MRKEGRRARLHEAPTGEGLAKLTGLADKYAVFYAYNAAIIVCTPQADLLHNRHIQTPIYQRCIISCIIDKTHTVEERRPDNVCVNG